MSISKFTLNMGPGNTIGAMAIGPGATAAGTVSIGGAAPSPDPDRVNATIDIKGASPERAAKWLRTMADAVEGTHTKTFAKTTGQGASVAWSWEEAK
jgi:hypothetical protein